MQPATPGVPPGRGRWCAAFPGATGPRLRSAIPPGWMRSARQRVSMGHRPPDGTICARRLDGRVAVWPCAARTVRVRHAACGPGGPVEISRGPVAPGRWAPDVIASRQGRMNFARLGQHRVAFRTAHGRSSRHIRRHLAALRDAEDVAPHFRGPPAPGYVRPSLRDGCGAQDSAFPWAIGPRTARYARDGLTDALRFGHAGATVRVRHAACGPGGPVEISRGPVAPGRWAPDVIASRQGRMNFARLGQRRVAFRTARGRSSRHIRRHLAALRDAVDGVPHFRGPPAPGYVRPSLRDAQCAQTDRRPT